MAVNVVAADCIRLTLLFPFEDVGVGLLVCSWGVCVWFGCFTW